MEKQFKHPPEDKETNIYELSQERHILREDLRDKIIITLNELIFNPCGGDIGKMK